MSFIKALKAVFVNIVVRNLLLLAGVCILLVFGVLRWLDIYTRHNEAIVVPNVTEMQVAEARRLIEAEGLRCEVVDSINSRKHKAGVIVDQIPQANSKVKQNRIVFLTINASKSHTVVVPDVMDLSQRQAIATLRALGFKVDGIEYKPYKYRDLVIDVLYNNKSIQPSTRIPYGSSLKLHIGDGFEDPYAGDSLSDTINVDSQDEVVDVEIEEVDQEEVNQWFE